jgi:hypothetical protein
MMVPRVLVHSANLGAFDETVMVPCHQDHVLVDYKTATDQNTMRRSSAMTSRLQARIPKCFGWDLWPGYDAYLWHDASLALSRPDSVVWFLDQLGDDDIAVFAHPVRHTVRAEAEFIQKKVHEGNRYLCDRYLGEDIEGQLRAINDDVDDRLYASGAFIYRPRPMVTMALKEWWYHISRFHSVDQLAFPYVTRHLDVQVIHEDIYHASHLTWVRSRHHG